MLSLSIKLRDRGTEQLLSATIDCAHPEESGHDNERAPLCVCERRQITKSKKDSVVVEHCLGVRCLFLLSYFSPATIKPKAKDQCCNYKHLFARLVQYSPSGEKSILLIFMLRSVNNAVRSGNWGNCCELKSSELQNQCKVTMGLHEMFRLYPSVERYIQNFPASAQTHYWNP